MADIEINGLPAAAALDGTELVPADQGAGTVKVTTATIAALASGASQPLDSDLTAIAALSTTAFGRAFLVLADAAAGRTALALGTAATQASSAFDAAGSAAAAQAASQPLDADLTAIAALTTTSYGRAFLALADAAAGRTALGLGTAATANTGAFDAAGSAAAAQAASQPLDADLTALAALTTTAYGRSLLEAANAAALRTLAGLGTIATQDASGVAITGGTVTGITDLAVADGGTGASTAAGARTNLGLGTAATVNTGTASGDLPLLSTGGVLPIARLATGTPDGTKFVRDDGTLVTPSGGGGGAPTNADYLVGTAHGDLSAEIVVGTSPGGELGGTWASPTVDASHSGSAHADFVAQSVLDANTILYATTDNTPAALAVAASRIPARLASGDIVAATPAEIRTLLDVPSTGQLPAALRRTGAIAETFSRKGASTVNLAATGSGTLLLVAIPLPAGVTVSSVTFLSGTAAMATPTNQVGVLYSSALALLANSADGTTAAWAASTEKTFTFSTPYVVPTAGLYYIGFWVTAATPPSLYGTTNSAATIGGLAPISVGTSNTGLTGTPPNPANALTAIVRDPWAYVS